MTFWEKFRIGFLDAMLLVWIWMVFILASICGLGLWVTLWLYAIGWGFHNWVHQTHKYSLRYLIYMEYKSAVTSVRHILLA